MSQKILVLSPLHNLGTTVAATMIAQNVTLNGRSAALAFTDVDPYIAQYTNLTELDDPMRSVTQVVKLIDSNAIENEDIIRYAHIIAKNLYFMNTSTSALTDAIKQRTVMSIFERITSDVVVCDCSEDIDSPIALSLLSKADMVFIVVNTSPKVFKHVHSWIQYSALKDKAETYLIINQYNEGVGALRDLSKQLYHAPSHVCKIHYNPWIAKCCLSGTLQTILPLVYEKDYRVANLYSDFQEIQQAIAGNLLFFQSEEV